MNEDQTRNDWGGTVQQTDWQVVRSRAREHRVRKASPGELVTTSRGWEIAREGDWVIEGKGSDQWLISTETLERYFEVVASVTRA